MSQVKNVVLCQDSLFFLTQLKEELSTYPYIHFLTAVKNIDPFLQVELMSR